MANLRGIEQPSRLRQESSKSLLVIFKSLFRRTLGCNLLHKPYPFEQYLIKALVTNEFMIEVRADVIRAHLMCWIML